MDSPGQETQQRNQVSGTDPDSPLPPCTSSTSLQSTRNKVPSPERSPSTPITGLSSPSTTTSTQKLRNLLIQGKGDSPTSTGTFNASGSANATINFNHNFDSNSFGHNDTNSSNDLLNDLLNRDKDHQHQHHRHRDLSTSSSLDSRSSSPIFNTNNSGPSSIPASTSNQQPSTPYIASLFNSTSVPSNNNSTGINSNLILLKASTSGQKFIENSSGDSNTVNNNNNNNMLRKLLNDDDPGKSSHRRGNQELSTNLWKDNGQSSPSNQSSGLSTSFSDLVSPTTGPVEFSGRRSDVRSGSSSSKRKSFDSDVDIFTGSQPSTPLLAISSGGSHHMERDSPVGNVVNNIDDSRSGIGADINDIRQDSKTNHEKERCDLSTSSPGLNSRSSSPIFSANSISGPSSVSESITNQQPSTLHSGLQRPSTNNNNLSNYSSNLFFKPSGQKIATASANSTTTNSNENIGSNNMLRKLLNDDDPSKSNRRNQEISLQFWKDDGQSSSSNQSSGLATSLSELISPVSGSTNFSGIYSGGVGYGSKRKSLDGDVDKFTGSQPPTPSLLSIGSGSNSKRPSLSGPSPNPQSSESNCRSLSSGGNTSSSTTVASSSQPLGGGSNVSSTTINAVSVGSTNASTNSTPSVAHTCSGNGQPAQLAGSNPMLASMLAQTPKTLPVAPISIPTSIVSQVPQERLPKNLEKKLIHTPASQQMVGVASMATPITASNIVVSTVTNDAIPVTSASTPHQQDGPGSTIHLTTSNPPLMAISPQQNVHHPQQSQSQSQHLTHPAPQSSSPSPQQSKIPHPPSASHVQTGQHFLISNGDQLQPQQQQFRSLHGQIQVQIVQSPGPRYQLRNVFTESSQQQVTLQQQSAQSTVVGVSGCHNVLGSTSESTAQSIPASSQRSPASSTVPSIVASIVASSSTSTPSSSASSSTTVHSHVAFIDTLSSTNSTSSSILASSSVLAAVQDTQDPLLSDILDQVWSMQQEMNIESTQNTITATPHSTTDDSMILDMMLNEVLDPPNVSISATVNSTSDAPSSPDLNEKLAISAIQRQLMSFENSPPPPSSLQHPHQAPPPAQSTSHQNLLSTDRPPIFNQTGPSLQQQPNFSNSPSFQSSLCPPPAYATRNPTQVHQVTSLQSQQQLIIQQQQQQQQGIGPGMRRLPGPPHPNGNLTHQTQLIQHRAAHPQFNVTPGVVRPPLQQQPRGKGQNDQKERFMSQQEQKLLAQQSQQEFTFPKDNTLNTDSILNQMPPNVALKLKPRLGPNEAGQLSPRHPIHNVAGCSPGASPSPSSGVLTTQPSASSASPSTGSVGVVNSGFIQKVDLGVAVTLGGGGGSGGAAGNGPGPGGGRPPPQSSSTVQASSQSVTQAQPQSSYPSPSPGGPATSPYGHPAQTTHHRMSPHPYSNVPSPVGGGGHGPNSPASHLQMASPQPSSTSSPVNAPHGWPPPSKHQPSSVGQSIRNLGPSGIPGNNRMQQQNPMLNAQLSSGTFSPATAQSNIRYTPQPPPTGVVGQRINSNQRPAMASPSPGPLHSGSRNSPIPQYPSSPGLFQSGGQTPVSSMGPSTPQSSTSVVGQPRLLSQPQPQSHQNQSSRPKIITARVNSPRFVNRDDSGNISGSYSPYPQPGTPVMDGNQNVTGNQFIFDNRSVSGTSSTSSTASPVSSEYVRQEIRAFVGARTQQTQQQQQQQQQQQHNSFDNKQNQPPSQAQSQQPHQVSQQHHLQITSSTSNSTPITPVDLDTLGFPFDFNDSSGVGSSGSNVANNCGPGSPLFSSMFDSGPQVSSPLPTPSSTSQGLGFGSNDNDSRSDQKRSSLLQQLLSSPP